MSLIRNRVNYGFYQIAKLDGARENCNFLVLHQIVFILTPLELAVKELSKDNDTLMSSEGVFKFIFTKLKENESLKSSEY